MLEIIGNANRLGSDFKQMILKRRVFNDEIFWNGLFFKCFFCFETGWLWNPFCLNKGFFKTWAILNKVFFLIPAAITAGNVYAGANGRNVKKQQLTEWVG